MARWPKFYEVVRARLCPPSQLVYRRWLILVKPFTYAT